MVRLTQEEREAMYCRQGIQPSTNNRVVYDEEDSDLYRALWITLTVGFVFTILDESTRCVCWAKKAVAHVGMAISWPHSSVLVWRSIFSLVGRAVAYPVMWAPLLLRLFNKIAKGSNVKQE